MLSAKNKWLALFSFSLSAGLSQFLWLNFAPLITFIQSKYGVSDTYAGLLILVFPLTYVILSIPSGKLIDRKGYRFSVCLGSIVMAAFACLRVYEGSFWVLLIAQIGISLAQPFIVNAITKLVLDWFEKEHHAIATGLGTMGMFIGMALGLLITPILVEAKGYNFAMTVFAIVSVLSSLLCFWWVTYNPEKKMESHFTEVSLGLKDFFADRQLLILFILSFLGLGFFNGLTTWIELIMAPNGINSIQAGIIGSFLIFGGIIGAVVIPLLSDYFEKRRPFLILSILMALATTLPLCKSEDYHLLLGLAFLQGFFFLPAYALLLEMCSEWVGEEKAGSATGILMLMGNAGGVIVIIAMDALKEPQFLRSVYLLVGILAVSFFTAMTLAETYPQEQTSL
jgi:MFS family permease